MKKTKTVAVATCRGFLFFKGDIVWPLEKNDYLCGV